MLEFNPNEKKSPKTPVWASYVPARSPEWKLHAGRGQAINAINNRATSYGSLGSPGIIYEFVDGEWVEWDRYERPKECAHCGGPFGHTERDRYFSEAYRLHWTSTKLYAFQKPVVCATCYEAYFGYGVPNYKENQKLCGLVDLGAEISG